MKIKVCFVSIVAYPLFNPKCTSRHGGAEVKLYSLGQELAKDSRFEVSFIVGDFGQKELEIYDNINIYKSSKLQADEKELSLFTRLLNSYYYLNRRYSARLNKFYQTMKVVNADIYIGSCVGVVVGIIALYCKINSKKFIYMTASSKDVDKSFINNNRIRGRFYKYGLQNNHLIITQNLDHQLLLKKNHNLPSMIVKNPVVIDNSSSEAQKKYILWVADSRKLKQPEIYLRVAKDFPRERFVMVMHKNDVDMFREIKKEASGIKNLTLIEHVPYHKIDRIYKKAKAFINTSTFEGFPNTFLQAAVNKTPLISLNVNPDNFITEYECGYFADGDFPKMIAQLQELIGSKEKLNAMGNNAFEYTKKIHDIKIIIEQFKGIINKIMDDSLCVE